MVEGLQPVLINDLQLHNDIIILRYIVCTVYVSRPTCVTTASENRRVGTVRNIRGKFGKNSQRVLERNIINTLDNII